MALLIAYTLHDVKALSYSPPFFTINDMVAKRMLSDLVIDNNTQVGRHPADFKLYKIGTFDEGNAIMTPLSIPEHVVDAVALVPMPTGDMFASMGLKRTPEERAYDRANGAA